MSEVGEMPVGNRGAYADHDEDLDGDADDEFLVCVVVSHVSVLLYPDSTTSSIRLHGPGINC